MSLVNLLSTGPGVFVYHFLILLVLEALIGISLVAYRRTRQPDHRRILGVFGGLMGMRVLLLLGERLGPDVIAPIFSGTELASLTLLGWVFLSIFFNQGTPKKYLVVGLVVTFLCTVTFLPWWYKMLGQFPHLLYFAFWQQIFWYAMSMLLALAPTLILLRIQSKRPWMLLVAFGTLSLGFAILCAASLFLTLGWLDISGYTLVGMGRLINMLGYPLFAVAVHQIALQDKTGYQQSQQRASEKTLHQALTLEFLTNPLKPDDESLNLNGYLSRVAQGTTATLDADLCAIFLVNSDDVGNINLTVQYPSSQNTGPRTMRLPLSLAEQPVLAYALKRRQPLILNVEINTPHLHTLYELLGNQEIGPTVIQPILNQHRALGVLVVGNGRSQRVFEPDAARMCQNIAEQIAQVLLG